MGSNVSIGDNVGCRDGFEEGLNDGPNVGSFVGATVGFADGVFDLHSSGLFTAFMLLGVTGSWRTFSDLPSSNFK